MFTVIITCLLCQKLYRTKHHLRCQRECSQKDHYDICKYCVARMNDWLAKVEKASAGR